MPSTFREKAYFLNSIFLVLLLSGCGNMRKPLDPVVLEMAKVGKKYYEEKCKNVAGEKIYRVVPNVEGILLMKVRKNRGQAQFEDPLWSGAAFANEDYDDDYLRSFLGYERAAGQPDGKPGIIAPNNRGYIADDKRAGDKPGYSFVDVIDPKDGARYRIRSVKKIVGRKDASAHNVRIELEKDPNYDLNVYRYILEKSPATKPLPRYGVTYEDYVIAEERSIGVASSTVKVIDLSTNAVLGEMLRYAYRPRGLKSTDWSTHQHCPHHSVGNNSSTRKFVDQVLIPKGE